MKTLIHSISHARVRGPVSLRSFKKAWKERRVGLRFRALRVWGLRFFFLGGGGGGGVAKDLFRVLWGFARYQFPEYYPFALFSLGSPY